MTAGTLMQLAGLAAFAMMAAFALLWAFGRTMAPAGSLRDGPEDDTVELVYSGERLLNASHGARRMLGIGSLSESTGPDELIAVLAAHFPGLADSLAALPETGRSVIADRTVQGRRLHLSMHGDALRVWIEEPPEPGAAAAHAPSEQAGAARQELDHLRQIANAVPFLVWRQDGDGRIVWANGAYVDLTRRLEKSAEGDSWPPIRIFADDRDMIENADAADPKPTRVSVSLADEDAPRWFECHVFPLGEGYLFTAAPIDATIRAETALRGFIQTLTKTFAHLTVGLAIFDRDRRLVLFNPALAELTSLKPEFLSTRPSLVAFLDRLRDKRLIPEPRDYKSWRKRVAELEEEAVDGIYEETWPLPSGQIYRVTGRPHPDGAIALLFEDKSAEISVTRRYRSQIETAQAVLDTMDEAIAVFSPAGALTLSNAAYSRLWGVDDTSLEPVGIVDATRFWAERTAPSPVWGDLRDFVGAFGERVEWTAQIHCLDGRSLTARFAPLAGGATLVGFRPSAAARPGLTGPVEAAAIEGAVSS